ncbi:hypothetical protein CEXT_475541 [Caerostris extrusa]|uniref:Uncharacterized protein n=1 Tax=Caerostris extrusa TaxID=172846 RepID=A0AAV4S6T5_CAEEX|nr:hypothetical protein CEXT_475541 [Caerostris extrusa]
MPKTLTNNIEIDKVTHFGHGAHLALVDAPVFALRILHLQCPVVRVLQVNGLEPLVAGVGEPAHGQDMEILASDPGHLESQNHHCKTCQYPQLHIFTRKKT